MNDHLAAHGDYACNVALLLGKARGTAATRDRESIRELFGLEVELAEGEYPAEYVIDIARALKEAEGDRWLHVDDSAALPHVVEFAIRANLDSIRETLRLANVSHDVYFSEASLHADGSVAGLVDAFRARGATYEADRARDTEGKVRRTESKASQFSDRQLGGTFLTTSAHGDDEDPGRRRSRSHAGAGSREPSEHGNRAGLTRILRE